MSSDDSDDSYTKSKRKKKAPRKKTSNSKTTPRNTRAKDPQKLVYKEESDSDEEESDDSPDDEDTTMLTEVSMQVDDVNAETIERVLKHREGIPGATGPPTTVYNIDEKGNPNQGAESKLTKRDNTRRNYLFFRQKSK